MKDLVLSLFPKTIFMSKLNNSKKEINEILKTLENIKTYKSYQNTASSYGNVTHASNQKNVLELLPKLKNKIFSKFNYFLKKEMAYKNDFKFTTSWISKTVNDQISMYHNHKNCMYSGVYYPDMDKDSAPLFFFQENNSSFFLEPSEHKLCNTSEVKIMPPSDAVIFFPSELFHCIGKHSSNKIRYCIAFNFFPIGNLGQADSYAEVKC